jgi:AcrR family transcriptional regulator
VVQFSNRRSIRSDARRVEIMRAAARVFRARGFAASGMRHIATAADLSPANLYHYFRGKDELLFFCQDRSVDRLLDALAAARKSRGPLTGRLREMAIAHVLCLLDEVEGSAAHLEVDALPPRLRALVAGGVRAHTLRASDATIATRAFLGALNWTAHWFRPEGPQSPQQVAELVADYAVAGLSNQQSAISSQQSHEKRPSRADRQRRADRGRLRPVQDTVRGAP